MASTTIYNELVVGSQPKFRLSFKLQGTMTPDDVDWFVCFRNGNKIKKFTKEECIKKEDEWFVILPTGELGAGDYKFWGGYKLPEQGVEGGWRDLEFLEKPSIKIYPKNG